MLLGQRVKEYSIHHKTLTSLKQEISFYNFAKFKTYTLVFSINKVSNLCGLFRSIDKEFDKIIKKRIDANLWLMNVLHREGY